MTVRSAAAAAVLGLAVGCVHAAGPAIDIEAGVTDRTLSEWTAGGARLVREHGPLAELQGTLRFGAADQPGTAAHLRLAQGRLNYDGQTQVGLPLQTHSNHTETEVGIGWRPLPASPWGGLEVGIDQLWWRRGIASAPTAGGLVETSNVTLGAVAWHGPRWQVSRWRWHLDARVRTSVRNHLDVDYGGVFDASSLHNGRRDEALLRASVDGPDGWSASIGWQHAREWASGVAVITRGGAPVGSVQQPRLSIDDVQFMLGRTF